MGDAKVLGNAKVWGNAVVSSPSHILSITPIGCGANSLTIFRSKHHDLTISFELDLYSVEGFTSYVQDWSDKYKKVALAAIELAKLHIDLSDDAEHDGEHDGEQEGELHE